MHKTVLRLLRLAYLTRYEEYAKDCSNGTALSWAGRSISACAIFNVASVIVLLIAITGGIKGVPREVVIGIIVLFSFGGAAWTSLYIENVAELEPLWTEIKSQSSEQKSKRQVSTRWYIWISFLSCFLSFGALVARVIYERNVS